MKDKEVIKALECCVDWCGNVSCWDCPLKNTGCIHFDKLKETLDLINRQKAEIERLTAERDAMHQDVIAAEEYAWQCKIAKAEAYKEFAERLKSRLITVTYINFDDIINSLLKEMERDNDE